MYQCCMCLFTCNRTYNPHIQVNRFGKKHDYLPNLITFASKITKVFMTIADYIIQYASKQNEPFQRADLMQHLESHHISRTSAKVALYRLARSGRLQNVGRGLYCLSTKHNMEFHYSPSEEEVNLARQVRDKFPFADFCIWKPAALIRYMQHIPALSFIFVDVEKDAAESVFYFLQGLHEYKTVLLNPTKQECQRYITSDDMIIVRTLINEAPVVSVQNYFVPTLEKILVDASGDNELLFVQGAELFTIYSNAFQIHDMNVSRLLRYAARRNRKDKVMKILNTINL